MEEPMTEGTSAVSVPILPNTSGNPAGGRLFRRALEETLRSLGGSAEALSAMSAKPPAGLLKKLAEPYRKLQRTHEPR
jgi:hypothetical protein